MENTSETNSSQSKISELQQKSDSETSKVQKLHIENARISRLFGKECAENAKHMQEADELREKLDVLNCKHQAILLDLQRKEQDILILKQEVCQLRKHLSSLKEWQEDYETEIISLEKKKTQAEKEAGDKAEMLDAALKRETRLRRKVKALEAARKMKT